MILESCAKELQGWHDFNVVREVKAEEMIRKGIIPLLTRWVHVWKVDSYGTKRIKGRLVILTRKSSWTGPLGRLGFPRGPEKPQYLFTDRGQRDGSALLKHILQ